MKFERNIEELPSTSRQIPAIKMSNLFGLSAGSIMEGQVEVVYTIQRYKDRIKTICSVEEYLSLILLLCDSASLVYTVFHLSSHFSFETSFTTRINVSRTHFQWNSIVGLPNYPLSLRVSIIGLILNFFSDRLLKKRLPHSHFIPKAFSIQIRRYNSLIGILYLKITPTLVRTLCEQTNIDFAKHCMPDLTPRFPPRILRWKFIRDLVMEVVATSGGCFIIGQSEVSSVWSRGHDIMVRLRIEVRYVVSPCLSRGI